MPPPSKVPAAGESEAGLETRTPALRIFRKSWAKAKIFPIYPKALSEEEAKLKGGLRYRWTRIQAKTRKAEAIRARGGVCMDCRWAFPRECFHFDHRPGTEKAKNLSQMWHTSSDEALAAELEKCDLVCANCHAIRTAERGYNSTKKKRTA